MELIGVYTLPGQTKPLPVYSMDSYINTLEGWNAKAEALRTGDNAAYEAGKAAYERQKRIAKAINVSDYASSAIAIE